MTIKILRADMSSVGIGIIAPTIDTCVWNILRKKITKPVSTVHSPSIFSVSIESVDGYNTTIKP